MSPRPPRVPFRLLQRSLREHPAGDAILGDLQEDFVRMARRRGLAMARLWYWREAVPLALSRLGRNAMAALLNRETTMHEQSILRSFLKDASYARRSLARAPAFAIFTAMVIGLGVGATTAVFSVLKPLMLAPLPFDAPEELVWIANHSQNEDNSLSAVTSRTSNLRDFRAQSRSFQEIAGYNAFFDGTVYTLTGDGLNPERLRAVAVTHNFLDVLGVNPAMGRNFAPDEENRGGEQQVILLTNGFWQRRFAGDPGIIGGTVTVDGEPRTVVGVLPSNFDFSSIFSPGVPVDFLQPWPITDETDRRGNTTVMIGRLRPGATAESAQADLDAVIQALEEDQPDRWGLAARVTPLQEHIAGPFRGALLLLAAAAATVLLIVCVNVSSLMLARAPGRAREVAVRKALGASRPRLMGQLVLESLAVSLLGGVLGAALAWGITGFVTQTAAARIPLMNEVGLDTVALLFAVGVSVLTGLVVGVAPALHVTDGDEAEVLRSGGRGSSAGRGATRLREILVVGEMSLACGLLVVGGLLLRSFHAVMDVDLGFNPENAIAWQLKPSRTFQSLDEMAAQAYAMTDRLTQVPGVVQAGLIDALPLGRSRSWGFDIPGRPESENDGLGLYPHMVDPRYLDVMEIPVLEGRNFNTGDDSESALVVLMNASAAARLFPDRSAVGQSILLWDNREWEIVGVVGDVHNLSPEVDPGIEVYFHLPQMYDRNTVDLVVRSTRPAEETAAAVSAALAEIDPAMPTREYWTLTSTVDRAMAARRFTLGILSAFGLAALVLAALGIYGVLAQSVAERTPEIGIRIALGASRGDVMKVVLGRTLVLGGMGVGVGTGLALWGSRMVRSLLFGVGPADPATFVAMGGVLLLVALVAAAVPAMRAARTRGAQALR